MKQRLDSFSLVLRGREYLPLVIGGMGVDISTAELAHVAARRGAIGHISDAMMQHVSDNRFGTEFTQIKSRRHKASQKSPDKSTVSFDLDHVYAAQRHHVEATMTAKRGPGLVFINVMEKLTMGAPRETLEVRLRGALDGGIDGVTLSAGLHTGSLGLIESHPRFRDVLIGPIVSSVRALKIFLRSAARVNRIPDYIVLEGPLAGGHLGFGNDWKAFELRALLEEVVTFLREEGLAIPVIPAGGVFTGSDGVDLIMRGASGVQVATRFTVTEESGLPVVAKQRYFEATEDDIVVNDVSPTGYLMRMLRTSPCLSSNVRPSCEAFGYLLSKDRECPYIDAYQATGVDDRGRKLPVREKICLCHHFSRHSCYTCGHNVYRLKDTTVRGADGQFELLTADHVLTDYLQSTDHTILLPRPRAELVH